MEQRHLTGGVLALFGVALTAIQGVHAFQQTDIPVAVAIDGIPFVAMGLGLVYAGYWVAREPAFEEMASRLAVWSAGGTVAFAAVASLLLFGQQVTTGSLTRANYLAMDLVTVGALAGVLVGIYDLQSRHRLGELERERERVEAFARKAADVNNYGRVISNARDVDEIAGYLVEAFETLVGVHETAVVRVHNGDVEPVADTIRTVDADAIADLATASLDQTPGNVVVHEESLPTELPGEVTGVLTARVEDDPATPTVVVAVHTDEGPIRDEDRKLLELLVSHVRGRR